MPTLPKILELLLETHLFFFLCLYEQIVNHINLVKLQLNLAKSYATEAPFVDLIPVHIKWHNFRR